MNYVLAIKKNCNIDRTINSYTRKKRYIIHKCWLLRLFCKLIPNEAKAESTVECPTPNTKRPKTLDIQIVCTHISMNGRK